MPQTLTDIATLAVLHCGVSKPINNVITEKSLEAQACRNVADLARQTTLRAHPWLFAKRFATPALVAGPSPMATIEWIYAYAAPADMLHMFRFISTRLNNDTRQTRIPYTIANDATNGILIYTNWPGFNTALPVTIEYVFDNQNISQWTIDFGKAMSYYMAYLIAPVLTSGDPYQMQQKLLALFDKAVIDARNNNVNEEQRPEEPQSEFVRARDGFGMEETQGQTWQADPSGFAID